MKKKSNTPKMTKSLSKSRATRIYEDFLKLVDKYCDNPGNKTVVKPVDITKRNPEGYYMIFIKRDDNAKLGETMKIAALGEYMLPDEILLALDEIRSEIQPHRDLEDMVMESKDIVKKPNGPYDC